MYSTNNVSLVALNLSGLSVLSQKEKLEYLLTLIVTAIHNPVGHDHIIFLLIHKMKTSNTQYSLYSTHHQKN